MAEGKHVVPSVPKLDPRHPKHTPHRPAYTTIIEGREFAMSDQIETIVSALYGFDVAEHAHFSVNGKAVPRHSLIDEHQGQTLAIRYTPPKTGKTFEVDPNWVHSIAIPEGFAV
eukprot:TRINITY_DN7274_c0_g1_i1.p1 TRINITY_DN7274_c0_g1~~TRINITY_DN7274_c0_g1_i1.p1  ORF type:complete len:114 (-),score=13.47 TRINITY_DN7274_c0_g1_i1:335-676(-)